MFHILSSWVSNKIHDLTTLCASCRECFDCIKTLLHIVVVDLWSLHLITSSLRLVNNPSSRKRLTTLSYHKLYTQCFTSRHHEISNKIHDLTTLCASCHECFDSIKTLNTSLSSICDPCILSFITSSCIKSISSRKRPTTLGYHKLYTMFHISSSCNHKHDSWSHNFYARHVTSVSIPSKLWTPRCRRSAIPASHHFITSSRQQRIVTKLYTHTDRWSFRFL